MYKLEDKEIENMAYLAFAEGRTKDKEKYEKSLKRIRYERKKCARELNYIDLEDNDPQKVSCDTIKEKTDKIIEKMQIEKTLLLLREEDRQIFNLICFCGYNKSEVSKKLGLPYKTVDYRYNRACKYLRNNYYDKIKPIWAI